MLCPRDQRRTNVARTVVAALIGTVHAFLAPLHAPLQERSFHPFAGLAWSRVGRYDGSVAEHFDGHWIPLEARTVPRPFTDTMRRNVAGAKSAETLTPAPTVTAHELLPEHAPSQRTSLAPVPGVAERVRRCPVFQVVVQEVAHCIPGTSAATEPGPEIVTANGACPSSRTSQGESCESVQPPECP